VGAKTRHRRARVAASCGEAPHCVGGVVVAAVLDAMKRALRSSGYLLEIVLGPIIPTARLGVREKSYPWSIRPAVRTMSL
jgi:hypothetical protein